MPLNGQGQYSPPVGTLAVPDTPIESAKYNAFVNDLQSCLNTPRSIEMGGTGATSAGAALSNLGARAALVGEVIAYAGTTAPTGWLMCYGQAVSRSTYSALFSVIGTRFGSGNGSTTFNLPDLRGRTIAGKDDMGGTSANRLTGQTNGGVDGSTLGATGGNETQTLTISQMPSHNHGGSTALGGNHSHTESYNRKQSGTGGGEVEWAERPLLGRPTNSNEQVDHTGGVAVSHSHGISSQGGGNPHNNVQPTIILNYLIKT